MAKTDVAEVKKTAVASYDYGEYAHAGFEDTSINDLAIPFINVLQSNSPQVEDQTIPGAVAGALLNSVTSEILKQPVVFQPVHKEEVWVEWKPRIQGGGLIDRYDPNSDLVKEVIAKNGGSRIPPRGSDGKGIPFKTPKGNDLIETFYVYGLILDETGEASEGYGVLSFSSTKIKVYKNWMTSVYTVKGRPPIFANRSKISTHKQKNEAGTFFNYTCSPFGPTWRESLIPPGHDLLQEGRDFREMILNGLARPDFSGVSGDEDQSSGGTPPTKKIDDDAPF